jgi:hypothetical protein
MHFFGARCNKCACKQCSGRGGDEIGGSRRGPSWTSTSPVYGYRFSEYVKVGEVQTTHPGAPIIDWRPCSRCAGSCAHPEAPVFRKCTDCMALWVAWYRSRIPAVPWAVLGAWLGGVFTEGAWLAIGTGALAGGMQSRILAAFPDFFEANSYQGLLLF